MKLEHALAAINVRILENIASLEIVSGNMMPEPFESLPHEEQASMLKQWSPPNCTIDPVDRFYIAKSGGDWTPKQVAHSVMVLIGWRSQATDERFIEERVAFTPIPRRPLTRKQWAIIIRAIVLRNCLWAWGPDIVKAFDDPSIMPAAFIAWKLRPDRCKIRKQNGSDYRMSTVPGIPSGRIDQLEIIEWKASSILRDIIESTESEG